MWRLRMRRWLASNVIALMMLFSCPLLHADSLPPEALDCFGKKVGDACTDWASKQAGSCQEGTCATSKLDAGTYGCLTCSGAPPSTDDGACTIGKTSSAKRLGPWLLAGSLSLLFLFRRRSKRPL